MTDIFRKEYKSLDEETKEVIKDIKECAEALYGCINIGGEGADSRAIALAKTNLEQCVMWAVKAIT